MNKPNEKFKLTVSDVEYIEKALRHYQNELDNNNKRKVTELLAKIHHQKVWFRPKDTYVSG
jgi:hypothetical protein